MNIHEAVSRNLAIYHSPDGGDSFDRDRYRLVLDQEENTLIISPEDYSEVEVMNLISLRGKKTSETQVYPQESD